MLQEEEQVEKETYQLVEGKEELSTEYFLHQYYVQGQGKTQYINVDAEIKAYLLIIADGKEVGKIIVGPGVQHIPLSLSYDTRLDIYVMPHETSGTVPVDNPETGQAMVWFNVL